MKIEIKVTTKASVAKVIGYENGQLRVKISAAPDKGKANAQLIELLSEFFKVPKSKIKIISGETSRIKLVEVCDS